MPEDKKPTPRPEPQRPRPEPVREDRGHPGRDSVFDEGLPSRVQPTQEWPRPDKKEK